MRHDPEFTRQAWDSPGTDRMGNPLGIVALDIGLTAALLAAGVWVGLPTVAAILLAWIGGAVATLGLLCAHALDAARTVAPRREVTTLP